MISRINKYFSKASILSKSPAVGDTAVLYLSTLISSGVGFVSSVIVARQLGPTEFAVVAGYNAIVLTLAGFTDFGLGTGLIKFTSPFLKNKKINSSAPYFRFVFILELVIGALLLSLGLLFAGFIPKLLGQNMSVETVRIAVVAASITSVAAYVGAAMAAHKKFKLNAIISIMLSVIKFVIIFLLWKTGNISVTNIILAYVLMSVISAVVGFAVAPKDYLYKTDRQRVWSAGRKVIRFSGWLTLSFFITSIMGKLDFFYLYKLKGPGDAGVYAAAQQLSMVYSIFVGAIGTVLTPYISEKVSHNEKINFLKKTLPLAFLGAALFIVTIPITPYIVNLVFGQKYVNAINPLIVLILSLAVNIVLIPITLMFIPLGKVKFGTYVALIQLGLSFLLYPTMIARFGAVGAAATILIAALFALAVYPIILSSLLRKEKYASK